MTTQAPHGNWLGLLRWYLAASAGLHLGWEILQLPLYTLWRTASRAEFAFAVIHCTMGDVMIASLALLAALVAFGRGKWPAERGRSVLAATVAIGAVYTVYSEWMNTIVRKNWAYADAMPLLPVLGTGLSPLLQWLLVPPLAYWVARTLCARPDRGGNQ